MRIGYFDCFSGAAGDMILGALVAAGLSPDDLKAELKKLPLDGYDIQIQPITKQGFAATKVDVHLTGQPGHRHLHHITKIIEESFVAASVKQKAVRIFERLAEAEAKVHGTPVEKVHFHEVGAVDAIVDIVGCCIGIERLGLERIVCSPLVTGSGTVKCEHGLMPVPAPATAELIRGVPLAPCDEQTELLTPTGAAILTTLADEFGPLPAMRVKRVGYSAGTRDGLTRPNILRLLVGDSVGAAAEIDTIVVLETNLDDATGQQIADAMGRLFDAGALDVFTTPISMKKGRPGVMVSVLVALERSEACEDVLLRHTPTFGVRRQRCERVKLERRIDSVETAYGPIRVKIGLRGGRVIHVAPEYEDCAAAARAAGKSLHEVMSEASARWAAKGPAR